MPIFEGRAEVFLYVEAADKTEAEGLVNRYYDKEADNLSHYDFEIAHVGVRGGLEGDWDDTMTPYTNSKTPRTIREILDAEAEQEKAKAVWDAHPKLPLELAVAK